MSYVVKNNAESTVADNPLAQAAVTLNVAAGEGANFPSTPPFLITLWDDATYPDPTDDPEMEIVKGTARSTDAITIARAQEGTADVAHALGERVAMLITAGIFNDATHGISTKLDTIETNADVTDAVNIASSIVGVDDKATPVDADSLGIIDSAAASVLKELTWANVKATLKTYFDTLYSAASHASRHQNAGADEINVVGLSGLLSDDQHVLDAEVQAVSINNVVEDTTPQLGGTLDCNSKQIRESKGADVASASVLPVTSDGNYFDVTGTNTITSINAIAVGTVITLHFDAALTLTHHADDLVLPGAANIITAAGDEAIFREYATGDWRCTSYTKAVTSYADATLSGTPRVMAVNINGAEYHVKVYPTKS